MSRPERIRCSRSRRILPSISQFLKLGVLCLAFINLMLLTGVEGDREASTSSRTSTTATKTKTTRKQKPVVSLSPQEFLYHIDFWTTDVAVFFYAPWCPYCKLIGPYWDMVGEWHQQQKSKDLVVARFDCEHSQLALDICVYMGVTQYPTIQFLGAGSCYQNDWFSMLLYGKQNVDRAVTFEGIPDPDLMKDWTNIMRGISKWHRIKNQVLGVVGLGPKARADIEAFRELEIQNRQLKEENRWLMQKTGAVGGGGGEGASDFSEFYGVEEDGVGGYTSSVYEEGGKDGVYKSAYGGGKGGVEGEGGDELIAEQQEALERYYDDIVKNLDGEEDMEGALDRMADELLGPVRGKYGEGDPFAELHGGGLNEEESAVVMACLRDFAGDYCRDVSGQGDLIKVDEPYCDLLPKCVETDFAKAGCLPAQCPLQPEGCERIRNCMREGVMDMYAQVLAGAIPA